MDDFFNNLLELWKQRNWSIVFGIIFRSFLKSGFSFACLQPSGNFDCRIERLHNSVIGSARAVATSLRNFPAILSKPLAFEGFISSKSLRTLSVDVGSSEKGSVRFKC